MILWRMWRILPPLHLSGALCIHQLFFWLEMNLSVSLKCSENMQSHCKGYCFHPESWCTHAHCICDCAGQKACSIYFKHISFISVGFLFFWLLCLSLGLKCFLCLLYHGKCMYVFACLNVRACAYVHVVSLRSQETLLVIRNLQQCHVSLSFSDSLPCYLHILCPTPDDIHLSTSLLSFFFSFPGTELFIFLLQSVFLLSERMPCTL